VLSGAGFKWSAYGQADATATASSLTSLKSRLVLPTWCWFTNVVLEKRPVSGCLHVIFISNQGTSFINLWDAFWILVFMATLHSRCGHYIFVLFLLLLLFPRLISAVTDWIPYFHTWCGLSANVECRCVKCAAHGLLEMQDQIIAKSSPFVHHRTTLLSYIFQTKACIDSRKKLVKQQYLPHMPYNMVNFGPLAAETDWRVWGTSANFNRFHVFAALLHGTLVVGISQALRCWTEGATYIRQGSHHVGLWPTF